MILTSLLQMRQAGFRLSKKSNRRKKVKKEKGFSLEEKLSTKLTDEGPRKRQKWQYHYICGTSCRPLIRQSQGDCHLEVNCREAAREATLGCPLQGEGLP